jgi:ribose transport system ATP-binding protein
VLDEPSATLPDHEMHVLMDTVRRVTRLGHAVLYVSHRLEEILAIADRITVLRDGRVVGTTVRAETNKDALLEMIVGRPVGEVFVSASHQRDKKAPSLAVVDLVAPGVQGVTFEVAAGEVLGVAGLADAGGRELLEALFGLRRAEGQILVQGRPVRLASPQAAVRAGVALVPADRLTSGIFQPMSILENVAIGSLHNYSRAGRIARRRLSVDSESELDQHRVRRAHSSALITSLSGGNQQKVVLARALRRRPEVLILDDPTQGVDVGAKADIWALIRRLTESGSSVVVHSTDYEELIDVADRVLVLRDGGVVADVAAADLDRQRLTELTYQPLTKLTSS